MKQLIAILFITVFFGCRKEAAETHNDNDLVDLIFTSTNTPSVVTETGTIAAKVKCVGPDLCYKFAKFDIKETAAREFEIRAKASYPKGNPMCAQALYQVDTTVMINAPTKGQYILRFYRNQSLFKADTVQVN